MAFAVTILKINILSRWGRGREVRGKTRFEKGHFEDDIFKISRGQHDQL